MSNENETQTSAEVTCPRCEGCGQLANDDERTPWTFWANLKPPSNMAVQVGMVRPEPCDECGGTGKATQPAGEHHGPIDDWPEPEGTFDEVLERAAQSRFGDGEHHTGTLNLTGEGNEAEGWQTHNRDECSLDRCGIAPGPREATPHGQGNPEPSPISDEIALAAAEAMHVYDKHDPWDDEGCNDAGTPEYPFPSCKEWTTGMARAALTAALPALRRQIAEEIAAWADDLAVGVINRDKPYNQGFIHASETLARHAREIGAKEAS